MGLGHSPSIIRDGLVLYLDAANPKSYPGSGTTTFDLKGNNNASLVNGVGYSTVDKGVWVFDGTNDYASLTTNIFTNSLPNFTISIWYKNSKNGILLGNHFHGSTWESIWTSTTTFGVNGANNHTTNRRFVSFSGNTFNTWNNLTFVNSSSLGYMKVFRNGNEIASLTATVVPWNSNIIPTIGAQRQNTGAIIEPIGANISQVSIYNKALSQDEIKQNFNALRGRYGI